eukprot:CAMPEP_0173367444 /NCGR_PEP_ID=MMETSP1144-20121109/24860_1 /TAXON_ID=483371 /ORGANISM="non described non described, Strain CCMP2298" /LENGTH=122 /DNA_ID=CAMNT_0014318337 /DNA_START=384 /DNA_END=749 /DNA_ORIENTATION=-
MAGAMEQQVQQQHPQCWYYANTHLLQMGYEHTQGPGEVVQRGAAVQQQGQPHVREQLGLGADQHALHAQGRHLAGGRGAGLPQGTQVGSVGMGGGEGVVGRGGGGGRLFRPRLCLFCDLESP